MNTIQQRRDEWEASLAKGRAIVAAEVEKSREVDQAFAAYLTSKLNEPTVPDAFAAGFKAGKAAPLPTAGERVADLMRLVGVLRRLENEASATSGSGSAIVDAMCRANQAAAAVEASARALLSASQEDAEHAAMYRWLRDQHESESAEAMCVFGPGRIHSLDPIGSMPGELDAAIRAAMSAKETK